MPATHLAYVRISTSTLCPAQAATSVGGTPELSRHVTPEWRRSYGRLSSGVAACAGVSHSARVAFQIRHQVDGCTGHRSRCGTIDRRALYRTGQCAHATARPAPAGSVPAESAAAPLYQCSAVPYCGPSAPGAHAHGRRRYTPCLRPGWSLRRSGAPSRCGAGGRRSECGDLGWAHRPWPWLPCPGSRSDPRQRAWPGLGQTHRAARRTETTSLEGCDWTRLTSAHRDDAHLVTEPSTPCLTLRSGTYRSRIRLRRPPLR
jgi:hypothetical protein